MRLSFDKGTLVLSDPHNRCPLSLRSRYFTWDKRTGVYRGAGYEYFFFFRDLYRARIPCQVVIFDATLRPHWQEPELRPYQKQALEAWLANGRGLVCLPTGAGKTIVAIAAMAQKRVPTLCMVPTRVLLEQWQIQIQKYLRGPCGVLGDGMRQIYPITVATYASVLRNLSWIGSRFKMLVVDEVHHFGASSQDEALILNAAPWRLGLSATPPDDLDQVDNLNKLVGPIVFETTIKQLQGSYLAPYVIRKIKLDLSPQELHEYTTFHRIFSEGFRRYAEKSTRVLS